MSETLFALAAASAAALGFLAVKSRATFGPRLAAVVLSVVLIAIFGAGFADLLGRPKPIRLELAQRQVEEADVLAARIVEGRGIYLWLGLAGQPEPRAYILPWHREHAQALQDAMRDAEKNGGQTRARLPFESSWERREPRFYALPQPKLPDKPPGAPPLQYERRTEGA